MTSLDGALREFEATEANLAKAESLAAQISGLIDADEDSAAYNRAVFDLRELGNALPAIDGWRPCLEFMELDEIQLARFDASEVDDPHTYVHTERQIEEPLRALQEYRSRFDSARRRLIRRKVESLIDQLDKAIEGLSSVLPEDKNSALPMPESMTTQLGELLSQVDVLLGSMTRPRGWDDMRRHVSFGQLCDAHDLYYRDWPTVGPGLRQAIYGERDPVPVGVSDLSELLGADNSGPVTTALRWDRLSAEEFERLLFNLITSEPTYENAAWQMGVNAPDRGRDLSVERVVPDALGSTRRERVIIQCKHWQSKTVGIAEIAQLQTQVRLWEPPTIDVCVVATSGRFSADAVATIEKGNQTNRMRVEMWASTHLESLLARRPDLVAEFGLR